MKLFVRSNLNPYNDEISFNCRNSLKSLEESSLLIKGVSETIKIEAENQNSGFLDMLLGTLDASLLRNLLTSKGVKIKIPERGVKKTGEGAIPTSQG